MKKIRIENQVVHLKLDDSISRSSLTEYLVDIYYQRNDQVLENAGSKLEKARKNNIKIINEDELEALLDEKKS